MSKPTIYEVKDDVAVSAPYFFSRDSMRCFGQTMRSFSVHATQDPRVFEITATMRESLHRMGERTTRRVMGVTRRFYAKGKMPGKGILALSLEGALEELDGPRKE